MLTEAVLQWATKDLVAASNWVNRFDASPDNDPAVAAIATDARLVAGKPETAVSWAESITTASTRVEALGAILRDWTGRDPAAAAKYLNESATLRAEDRGALRAMMGKTN